MTNLEYLNVMKENSYREHQEHTAWKNRQVLALEIIAEELCKSNVREDNKYSDKIEQVYVAKPSKNQIKENIKSSLNLLKQKEVIK